MSAGGEVAVRGNDGTFWLWALSISGGLLAASKWNGLFDFFVVWLLVAFVIAQPYLGVSRRRAAALGQPPRLFVGYRHGGDALRGRNGC